MNKGIDGGKMKTEPSQKPTALDNERLCRLASSAIARGQTKALRRYLAEGLAPDSPFYDGRIGPAIGSLIGRALWIGSVDCFKVLVAAGAEVGQDEIEVAIRGTCGDTQCLQHLFDSGKLDPSDGPRPGVSWVEFADLHSDGARAKDALLNEISERERAALNSTVAPAQARRARRSL